MLSRKGKIQFDVTFPPSGAEKSAGAPSATASISTRSTRAGTSGPGEPNAARSSLEKSLQLRSLRGSHLRTKGMFMKTTRIIAIAALIATTGLVLNVTQAQQVGGRRIDLQRHDLSVTGREVVQTIVELAPGTTAPRHTHPGEEIIYVLEGTWEYTVEGKPPVILKSGGVLFIPAGAIHSARNVGTGRAAELATYIVEKGKPLITVVERAAGEVPGGDAGGATPEPG